MVAWDKGYSVTNFKGYCGVTQEGPLSPKIYTMVIDVVLLHRFTVAILTEEVVELGASGMEGFGWDVQQL